MDGHSYKSLFGENTHRDGGKSAEQTTSSVAVLVSGGARRMVWNPRGSPTDEGQCPRRAAQLAGHTDGEEGRDGQGH